MNDKKKLAIVIALAVVVLGIGAFQFVNSSGEATPPAQPVAKTEPAPTEKQEPNATEIDPALQSLLALNTAERDPFQTASLPLADGQTPPPPPVVTPRNPGTTRPPAEFRLPKGFPDFKPMDPGVGTGGVNVDPSVKLRLPGEFAYRLAGVITGNRPAAVFVDDNGNQRLVTIGSSIDGDSRLVDVERGQVTVRHKNKTQTLTVGGTPNDK